MENTDWGTGGKEWGKIKMKGIEAEPVSGRGSPSCGSGKDGNSFIIPLCKI